MATNAHYMQSLVWEELAVQGTCAEKAGRLYCSSFFSKYLQVPCYHNLPGVATTEKIRHSSLP